MHRRRHRACAPLRPIINYVRDNRDDYAGLEIIYGARTPADLVFTDELKELQKKKTAKVHLTVDVEAEGWKGNVGFVPQYLLDLKPAPKDTIAITCGPPIMIKFVLENLVKLKFKDDQIFTTLENRMKCGIGKCGKCNVGEVYVCKDGPVFSYAQYKTPAAGYVIPADYSRCVFQGPRANAGLVVSGG